MSSTAPATLCPGTAQSLQAPRRRAGPFSPAAGNTWDRNPCLRTSVAMARLGMLRTPTVIIDTAKRKVSKYRLDCLQEDKAFLPLTVRRGVAVPSRHGELIAQPIARRAATLFFPRGSRAPCHYGTARGVRARRTAHTHTHTTPDGGQHLGSRHFSSPSTSGRLHGKFVRFCTSCPPPLVRRTRRTKSCVSNAARSSTSIGHASMSRAPKLVHFGWGVLPLHTVKRRFRRALQDDLDAHWGG